MSASSYRPARKKGGAGVVLAIIGAAFIILLALCVVIGGIFYLSGGLQSEALAFLHTATPTQPTSTPRPTHTPRPTATITPSVSVTPSVSPTLRPSPSFTPGDYPGNTQASDYLIILRTENSQVQQRFNQVEQRLVSLGYRVQRDSTYGMIGAIDAVQYGNLDCLQVIDILHVQLRDLVLVPENEIRFTSNDLSYEARNIVIQIASPNLLVNP